MCTGSSTGRGFKHTVDGTSRVLVGPAVLLGRFVGEYVVIILLLSVGTTPGFASGCYIQKDNTTSEKLFNILLDFIVGINISHAYLTETLYLLLPARILALLYRVTLCSCQISLEMK